MRELALAILCLAVCGVPARPASFQFSIELFSNRTVKALSLESTVGTVDICGARSDGPCWKIPSGQYVSCIADRFIQCRSGTMLRNFSLLTVDSSKALRLTPAFTNFRELPQTVLIQNLRVNLTRAGLQAIQRVDLEAYVSGVLRGEASVLQTPAAREAMAIVARTWAVRWQRRHHTQGFDFCSLTHCQVFHLPTEGESNARSSIEPTARATSGQVLCYHGVLADPYFTACCGGTTEAAANVWPDRGQPYLSSNRDPYCLGSSHATWRRVIPSETLDRVLRVILNMPIKVPLAGISVEKRDSSGRVQILRLVGGTGGDIDANQFRYAVDRRLGWGEIESNLYTVQWQGNGWVFLGRGLGHGVGLCQAGAEQMARMGSSVEKILSTYFPGTDIAPLSSDDSDPVVSSEHFELAYPSSQGPWVTQALECLEHWRKELGPHTQLLPTRVKVQAWASTSDFIRATGQPGWVAATSDGQTICVQPLDLLARKQILSQTLRHEVTHLAVHHLRAGGVPRWYEEGFVLYLTGERIEAPAAPPAPFHDLDEAIVNSHSEAEMKAAYARALERVKQRARDRADTDLWRLLQHPSPEDLHWFRQSF